MKSASKPCVTYSNGEMGVPVTYLSSPSIMDFMVCGQFNNSDLNEKADNNYVPSGDTEIVTNGIEKLWNGPVVNKKALYKRVVIRRR